MSISFLDPLPQTVKWLVGQIKQARKADKERTILSKKKNVSDEEYLNYLTKEKIKAKRKYNLGKDK